MWQPEEWHSKERQRRGGGGATQPLPWAPGTVSAQTGKFSICGLKRCQEQGKHDQ